MNADEMMKKITALVTKHAAEETALEGDDIIVDIVVALQDGEFHVRVEENETPVSLRLWQPTETLEESLKLLLKEAEEL